MPILNRDFTKGKMNLDSDERLLPPGEYREAVNVNIANSESDSVGSIQKPYSNKRLTNINFGTNVKCVLGLADETKDKLYYFIKSSNGCYLMEWDNPNQVASFVLIDTRALGLRVLDLDENFLITGIEKIITDDVSKDMLLWTDDNMQPCCINIERAKSWGANNFTKEDIYLTKKPPIYAPALRSINIAGFTNNMEEKFLTFTYRYKYLDGFYSALSTYTNYAFAPKDFKLNYYTLDNLGMVNAFNAVRIEFNTGESQVTDIEVLVKQTNSNTLYLIKTFNKADNGWGDGQVENFTFSNNSIYQALPEKELFRNGDYVPLKAKALTIIDNVPVFGNYVEGMDMIDSDGGKIKMNYQLELINDPIDTGYDFDITLTDNNIGVENLLPITLNNGNVFVINLSLLLEGLTTYLNNFYYILPQNFNTLEDLFIFPEFEDFISIIETDFLNNYQYDVPSGWVVDVPPTLVYSIIAGVPTFTITPVTFIDTFDMDTPHTFDFTFFSDTTISLSLYSNSTSLKTNRDYEVGVVYEEDFCRQTPVVTSLYNSIYVPQIFSICKNRIKITLNSRPPADAVRYQIVVKCPSLQYQTVYVNIFYNEDFYVWCKLVAENKDKVKVGDFLVVKKAPEVIPTPIKVKVLEIKEKEKDFIIGNFDANGNPLLEDPGLYMKIRPEGFSMDYNDYRIYQDGYSIDGYSPVFATYLNLFSEETAPGSGIYTDLAIPTGTYININVGNSRRYGSSNWRRMLFSKEYYAQRDYASIEDWFLDIIIDKDLFAVDTFGNVINHRPYFRLNRGTLTSASNGYFTNDPTKGLYFRVAGIFTNGSGERKAYLDARIVVRTNSSYYVFETLPKSADENIFFQTSQKFDIVNGNHQGSLQHPIIQNQDYSILQPAIIDLDFFNCYTQGNGVESYRVKDGFNTNYLNVDLRPSTTLIEESKQIRKRSDLIFGQPYVDGINVNGLNEFNLSTFNFKQLDKQYGSIQKLASRNSDLIVFQEEKASKVLFNKIALYKSDGDADITTSDLVLGDQVVYLGENGIGTSPEGFARHDYQIYYPNPKRSVINRLSIDGVTDIVDNLNDWFRDKFFSKPNANLLGGYDPYHNQYFVSFGEDRIIPYEVGCGTIVSINNLTAPFTYTLNLNNLEGDIILNYIINGNATIVATYGVVDFVASNVTGTGDLTIPRDDLEITFITIVVTPIPGEEEDGEISLQITNVCPIGIQGKVVYVVVGDSNDTGDTITNRYRSGIGPFYSNNDVFTSGLISRFSEVTGNEGSGRIPLRGSIVNIQSYKDVLNDGTFSLVQCNKIGYLITEDIYTSADIDDILSLATYISLTDLGNIFSGNFLFNKTTDAEILYLVWDYTDKKPILNDDTLLILNGSTAIINMIGNDAFHSGPSEEVEDEITVAIVTGPTSGIATLNPDNTITYTHDESETTEDTITYSVTQHGCTATAVIYITIYTEVEAPTLFRYSAGKKSPGGYSCGGSHSLRLIYVNIQPFSSLDWYSLITLVYSDEAGTIPAAAGWYADIYTSIYPDGWYYFYWNGIDTVSSVGTCGTI